MVLRPHLPCRPGNLQFQLRSQMVMMPGVQETDPGKYCLNSQLAPVKFKTDMVEKNQNKQLLKQSFQLLSEKQEDDNWDFLVEK